MAKGISFRNKGKKLNYALWGYLFILPFFIVYFIFSIIPLFSTFYYSFFEHYKIGFTEIGPNFDGFNQYIGLFKESEFLKYFGNTMIMWIMGFIPQIIISLLLAVWFTDRRLKIKGAGFFKAVIYMPNLIMSSAFAALLVALFGQDNSGPLIKVLQSWHIIPNDSGFRLTSSTWLMRWVIAFMNFIMWFGNTTILLMAGVMGIDDSIYEAATIDGAGPFRTFFDITMPLLMPIFIYVFITSLIGGVQMYDVPQVLTQGAVTTQGQGCKTVIMQLHEMLRTKNDGRGGALSVLLFIITMILSLAIFKINTSDNPKKKKKVVKKVGGEA